MAHSLNARKFVGQLTSVSFFQLINSASAFLANVLLARWLGPSAFGDFYFFISTAMVSTILFDFGLTRTLLRYSAFHRARGELDQKLGYYAATLRLKLGLGVLLLMTGLVLTWWWGGAVRVPLLLGLVTGFSVSYNQFLSAVAQTEENYTAYNLVLSFNTLRLALIAGLVVWGCYQLGYFYAAFISAPVFLTLWPSWRLGQDLRKATRPPESHFYNRLIHFGKWMMILAVIETAYQRLDVLLLRWLSGAEAAGHYASALAFFGIVYLLPAYVAILSYPRFVDAVSRNDFAGLKRHYHLATELVSVLSVPLALGLWALAPDVIQLILGAEYAPAQPVFVFLAAYSLVWAFQINSGAVFFAQDRPRDVVLIMAAALVVSVTLGLLLIPGQGIIGAGWAVSTAMAVSLALYWTVIRVKFKLQPRWLVLGSYLLAGGVMAWVVQSLPQGEWPWFAAKIAIGGGVYGGIVLLVHRFLPGGALPLAWKSR